MERSFRWKTFCEYWACQHHFIPLCDSLRHMILNEGFFFTYLWKLIGKITWLTSILRNFGQENLHCIIPVLFINLNNNYSILFKSEFIYLFYGHLNSHSILKLLSLVDTKQRSGLTSQFQARNDPRSLESKTKWILWLPFPFNGFSSSSLSNYVLPLSAVTVEVTHIDGRVPPDHEDENGSLLHDVMYPKIIVSSFWRVLTHFT